MVNVAIDSVGFRMDINSVRLVWLPHIKKLNEMRIPYGKPIGKCTQITFTHIQLCFKMNFLRKWSF